MGGRCGRSPAVGNGGGGRGDGRVCLGGAEAGSWPQQGRDGVRYARDGIRAPGGQSMKILAYTSPSKGHLYPLVPSLLELRSRGDHVVVRTLASEVELLERLGFAAAPISPLVDAREMDDWCGKNQLAQVHRALNAFVERAQH